MLAETRGESSETLSNSSAIGRIAAILALVGAVVVIYLLLTGGKEPYKVTAEFENASQLVTGNEVKIAGGAIGSVEKIDLGDNGQARITFTVSDDYAPLRRGTEATVRSYSLSGVANRYIELSIPPDERAGDEIESGGLMTQNETVSEVDLDEIFNTLDDETIGNLKKVIRGFELSYEGVAPEANEGFKYLNPFLSTSRRVFAELTRDERALERLIVDGAQLSGALAERSDDVTSLVGNLDVSTNAIARQRTSLTEAVNRLPNFLRNFNTTAVNLRAALDDVDPLVDASKPAARELQDFLPELRVTARNLVPTIKDLDQIVKAPGPDNDLVDLNLLQPDLAKIAIGPVNRNGKQRPGAFPESSEALRDGLDELAFFRAYSPELTGWFNDFGTSGLADANGGIGRIGTTFNTFAVSPNSGLPIISPTIDGALDNFGALSGDEFQAALGQDNLRKCPGANTYAAPDGSTPFTEGGTLDCDPSQTLQMFADGG